MSDTASFDALDAMVKAFGAEATAKAVPPPATEKPKASAKKPTKPASKAESDDGDDTGKGGDDDVSVTGNKNPKKKEKEEKKTPSVLMTDSLDAAGDVIKSSPALVQTLCSAFLSLNKSVCRSIYVNGIKVKTELKTVNKKRKLDCSKDPNKMLAVLLKGDSAVAVSPRIGSEVAISYKALFSPYSLLLNDFYKHAATLMGRLGVSAGKDVPVTPTDKVAVRLKAVFDPIFVNVKLDNDSIYTPMVNLHALIRFCEACARHKLQTDKLGKHVHDLDVASASAAGWMGTLTRLKDLYHELNDIVIDFDVQRRVDALPKAHASEVAASVFESKKKEKGSTDSSSSSSSAAAAAAAGGAEKTPTKKKQTDAPTAASPAAPAPKKTPESKPTAAAASKKKPETASSSSTAAASLTPAKAPESGNGKKKATLSSLPAENDAAEPVAHKVHKPTPAAAASAVPKAGPRESPIKPKVKAPASAAVPPKDGSADSRASSKDEKKPAVKRAAEKPAAAVAADDEDEDVVKASPAKKPRQSSSSSSSSSVAAAAVKPVTNNVVSESKLNGPSTSEAADAASNYAQLKDLEWKNDDASTASVSTPVAAATAATPVAIAKRTTSNIPTPVMSDADIEQKPESPVAAAAAAAPIVVDAATTPVAAAAVVEPVDATEATEPPAKTNTTDAPAENDELSGFVVVAATGDD